MKNTLEGIKSKLEDAEVQISNLEDRVVKNHSIGTVKRKKEPPSKIG